MTVLGKSDNFGVVRQNMAQYPDGRRSGCAQLWGHCSKKGQWVDLQLPVAADGRYQVVVYMTKACDYGIVQFSLDGKPIGPEIDAFDPSRVISTGPLSLGTLGLRKGTSKLRVEVVGTNEKTIGWRFLWGLDCVVLKPVRLGTFIPGRFDVVYENLLEKTTAEFFPNKTFMLTHSSALPGTWEQKDDTVEVVFANKALGKATLHMINPDELAGKNVHANGRTWNWSLKRISGSEK